MNKMIGLGLTAGLIGGLASFGYARLQVTPLISQAVDYEGERSHTEAELTGGHAHGHELFTRTFQENVGAGVGVVVLAMVLGALFAVAFVAVSAYLKRRGTTADGRRLATALAAAGFVAINLVPFAVFPANPPGVGQEESMADRTIAYLAILMLSVGLIAAAIVVAGRLAPRIGSWTAGVAATLGYLVSIGVAAALSPRFDEIPVPLTHEGVIVFPGFPAALLADFRLHSMVAAGVLWLMLGTVFAGLLPRVLTARSGRPTTVSTEEIHVYR